jgi:hypothetical protein
MASRALRKLIPLTAAALTISACSGGSSPIPFAVGTAEASPDGVSRAPIPERPSAVDVAARGAVQAWLSYDTTVDQRPNDTARRLAIPWLTPALGRQVTTFTGPAAPDQQWQQWTRHHARAAVSVSVGGDEHPADTSDEAWRQTRATIKLRGDDGWVSSLHEIQFVHLRQIGRRWLVADLLTAPAS